MQNLTIHRNKQHIFLFSTCVLTLLFFLLARVPQAKAQVFYDSFTEPGNDKELSQHDAEIPLGTGDWIRLISIGSNITLEADSGNDYLQTDNCSNNQGVLYRTKDIIVSADYEVSVVQTQGDTRDDVNFLAARIQDVSNDMYAIKWNEENRSEDNPGIYKRSGVVLTQLDNINGLAISNGSTVSLKVDGSLISMEVNGTPVASYNDPSPLASAGYAGIGMGALMVAGDDCDKQKLDDFTVTLLTPEPIITFDPPSRTWDDTDISVTVTATDPDGIVYTRHCWTTDASCDPGTSSLSTFTNGATLTQVTEGDWSLCVRAQDGTGLWNSTPQCGTPYQKDASDPNVDSLGIDAPISSNGAPIIDWTVSDTGPGGLSFVQVWRKNEPCSGSTASWNNVSDNIPQSGSSSTGNWQQSPTLSDGFYCYGLHVDDVAGNFTTEAPTQRQEVEVINNNPPTEPVISGPYTGYRNQSLTFTFNATDPEGDNVYYDVDINDDLDEGNLDFTIGPYVSGQDGSFSWQWLNHQPSGPKCISGWANDLRDQSNRVDECFVVEIENRLTNSPNVPSPANSAVNVPIYSDISFVGGDPDGVLDNMVYTLTIFESGVPFGNSPITQNASGADSSIYFSNADLGGPFNYSSNYTWSVTADDSNNGGATMLFRDFFTENADTVLEFHTPNIGLGWTWLYGVPGTPHLLARAGDLLDDDSFGADRCGDGEGVMYVTTNDFTGIGYDDYEVVVWQRDRQNYTNSPSFLSARVIDANNFYALEWTLNYTRLYRVVGGVWTQLGPDGAGVDDYTRVTFEVNGNTLQAKVDQTVTVQVTDTTFGNGGRAGIGSGALHDPTKDCGLTQLDNFMVWVPQPVTGPTWSFSTIASGVTPGANYSYCRPDPSADPYTVLFSGSATGGTAPYTYNWDFGDTTCPGNSSCTQQNPTHTFIPGTGSYVEFQDTFTESSYIELSAHTPNIGDGWTRLYEQGSKTGITLGVDAAADTISDYVNDTCGNREGVVYATENLITHPDYEISAIILDSQSGDDGYTFAARIKDASNFYALQFNKDYFYIFKQLNGVWTTLAFDSSGNFFNDFDTVTFKVEGNNLSGLVNDNPVITASDSSLPNAGRAGAGMGKLVSQSLSEIQDCATSEIDDFTVTITGYTSDSQAVSLVITDSLGQQHYVTQSFNTTLVTGCNAPVAEYEYCRPDPAGQPNSVQFFDTSTEGVTPYTWNWDFGDGSIDSNAQHPLHTFSGTAPTTQAQYQFEDAESGGGTIDVCYTIAENERWFKSVNPTSGADSIISQIGSVGDNFQSIALNPSTGTLYTASNDRLAIINIDTGSLAWLPNEFGTGSGSDGNITFTNPQGLTFDSGVGYLYGTIRNGGKQYLFRINPSSGAYVPNAFGAGLDYIRLVGGGLPDVYSDIAVDPTNGEMYAIVEQNNTNDTLVQVNKITGIASMVNHLGIGDVKGLGFDPTGVLYATTAEDSNPASEAESLWTIDKTTAVPTLITQFSTGSDHESIDCLTLGTTTNPSNSLSDSSGNGNDGTLVNTEQSDWVSGVTGQALRFDGVDEYVVIPHSTDFELSSGKIEFDFRIESDLNRAQTLFAKDYNGFVSGGHIYITFDQLGNGGSVPDPPAENLIRVRLQSQTQSYFIHSNTATPIIPGEWYHFEFWFGASGMVMAVNGVIQSETNTYTGGIENNQEDIILAGNNFSNGSPVPGDDPVMDLAHATLDNLNIFNIAAGGSGLYPVVLTTTGSDNAFSSIAKSVDPTITPTCNFDIDNLAPSTCTAMNVLWDNPNGMDNYELFRALSGTGTYSSRTTIDAQDMLACNALECNYDDTVTPGLTYDYYIEGTQFNSNVLTNNNGVQTASALVCTPSNIAVTPVGCAQLDVSWSVPGGVTVDGYNVYRSLSGSGPFAIVASFDPATYCPSGCALLSPSGATTYSDVSVFANVQYYYQITAVVSGGETPPSSPPEPGRTSCFRSPIFIEN